MEALSTTGDVKAELSVAAAVAAPSASAVDPTALLQPANAPTPAEAPSAAAVAAETPRWHTADDRSDRVHVIEQIVRLLRRRKPGAQAEWIAKLPEMARRLEDRLYRAAATKEEYTCMETLKERLQDMAIKMGAKASRTQRKRSGGTRPRATALHKAIHEAAQAGQIRQHPTEGPVVIVVVDGETQMVPISRLRRDQQDMVYQMYKEHRARQQQDASSNGTSGAASSGRNASQPQAKRAKRMQSGGGASRVRSPNTSKPPPLNKGEHRKAIMRQQQQRLLLLRHASKCQEKRGKCKATELCAQVR